MYRALDAGKIVETAQVLCQRVNERFPDSALNRVADEALSVCRRAADFNRWLAEPLIWVRIGVATCIVLMLALFVGTLFALNTKVALFSSVADFLQGLESATNELVLLGLGVFFLFTIETRIKRARALKSIHELRSLCHIIDLHQLTKDPERLSDPAGDTPSSPERTLSAFELTRYLDYCSEMLAILSKVAALYVQNFQDPVTLAAVNEVENLALGLSRNIWQKIMILDRVIAPK